MQFASIGSIGESCRPCRRKECALAEEFGRALAVPRAHGLVIPGCRVLGQHVGIHNRHINPYYLICHFLVLDRRV